jgi:hypothetical protein
MVAPPLSVGAVNARLIWLSPAVATRPVGAPAVVTDIGVALKLLDAVPSPTALTAFSRMVYDVPFVNPVITTGELVSVAVT